MDHMSRGQVESARDPGLARGAAHPGPDLDKRRAGRQKAFSRRPVDRPVDPAAAQEGLVGGVDDGIHVQGCDVGFPGNEGHGCFRCDGCVSNR
ncbi:hypothetical protein KCV01_g2988, partial [Aureobasidium melanogenum]